MLNENSYPYCVSPIHNEHIRLAINLKRFHDDRNKQSNVHDKNS